MALYFPAQAVLRPDPGYCLKAIKYDGEQVLITSIIFWGTSLTWGHCIIAYSSGKRRLLASGKEWGLASDVQRIQRNWRLIVLRLIHTNVFIPFPRIPTLLTKLWFRYIRTIEAAHLVFFADLPPYTQIKGLNFSLVSPAAAGDSFSKAVVRSSGSHSMT